MRTTGTIIALGLAAAMPLAMAADNYSDTETHVMRGISERQNTMGRWSALAAEKGSTEMVRRLARLDMDEHAKLNIEVRDLAAKIGISGVGMGAPGGAPGAGGPPGAAGGAPGGARAGGGGGGPNSYASKYSAQLAALSGEAFDEMYLLRALQYHEDLERTLSAEIRDGVNPELIAWSKANIKNYEAHSATIQRALYGELTSIPADAKTVAEAGARRGGPPAGGAAGAAPGGTPAAPTAK
jgi:predicted outer membrane protein